MFCREPHKAWRRTVGLCDDNQAPIGLGAQQVQSGFGKPE
jgi:hypothetical protein